jgi:nitronate monooxygenase
MAHWQRTRLTERLGIDLPIVQAPMAGGPTTPALVAAVSNAGGLGSLGAAYLDPDTIRQTGAEIRALTDRPFAINLFMAENGSASPAQIDRANALMAGYRQELGLDGAPPDGTGGIIDSAAQVDAVLAVRPAVFSFTFGMAPPPVIQACRQVGIVTIGTATNLAEARALADAGIDAIAAQGSEAGGHRGTFLGRFEDALIGAGTLTRQIARAVDRPVIAAGGIMDGNGIAAALLLGADAVIMGTAFLCCPEAGTSAAYRRALLSPDAVDTAVTRAFSGRPARGVVNRFLRELAPHEHELPPYPITNALTRDIRQAAARQDRPEFLSLWAGQGAALCRTLPAADLIAALVAETEAALGRFGNTGLS